MVSVSVKCEICRTPLEWPDNAVESTVISCTKCGNVAGTYGDIVSDAERAAREAIEKALQDIIDRR